MLGKFIGNFVELFFEWIIEHICLFNPAAHNGVVGFLHLMIGKHRHHFRGNLTRKRKHQHTGCRAIQTV
ncbi:Uncharacterised protein [Vibrio cholerae]|uniref:Uncharacterized protein n=1 Tax=Vibrio cholerae TaxID=666 RepID=A0A656AJY0_VIBCL|nr:Uncharacterised protein [Vibrio cholerae]